MRLLLLQVLRLLQLLLLTLQAESLRLRPGRCSVPLQLRLLQLLLLRKQLLRALELVLGLLPLVQFLGIVVLDLVSEEGHVLLRWNGDLGGRDERPLVLLGLSDVRL